MIVVGLTGGIGSGKSTVAAMLAARGAVVIDADAEARRLAAPGGASYQALVDHFGPSVVNPDGTLDRRAIAARVFTDPSELAALDAITHPAIAAAIESRLATLAGDSRPTGELAESRPAGEAGAPLAPPAGGPVVVIDLPLLDVAARMRYRLAAVVVVDAPVEVARRRLIDQRGLAEADADARIAVQMGREERRQIADVVIDNSGSRAKLAEKVDQLWAEIGSTPLALRRLRHPGRGGGCR